MSSSHPLVERFRDGAVPPQVKAAAARGALPLPPADLLEVLFHLRREKDLQPDIVATVSAMPEEPLLEVAGSTETEPLMLDFLARASFKREPVLERLLLNPGTPDATFTLVAAHAGASMLELMVLNQVRLTRSPDIIKAILKNPNVTLTLRRRLKEVWDLHQAESAARAARDKARLEAVQAAEAAEAAEAPAATEPEPPAPEDSAPEAGATGAEAGSSPGEEPDLEDLEDLEDLASGLDEQLLAELREEGASEEELRLAERLFTMTVAEKVQLALKGDRGARSLLIRDSSKQVQEAVIKSPKVTEDEIEKIANMRSIAADILRMISQNRDYTKNYSVTLGLVKNPRTPQPSAIQLMPRLQSRDLKFMLTDKNIPEAIRRHARILLQKRDQKK